MPIPLSPALPPALCTLAEIKAQLNKTSTADDVELQSYIDAVTAAVEDYCGAVLPTTTTEWHDPLECTLTLRERCASVTTVAEYRGTVAYPLTVAADPSSATTYSFMVDPSLPDVLIRLSASGYPQEWFGRVKVVYTAGFAVIPTSLNLAARLIVQTMWRTQNGGAGLPQLSDEPDTQVAGFDSPIPSRALVLMDRYRRLSGFA